MPKNAVKELGGKTLIIKPKIKATIKLAKGPAAPTIAMPYFLLLKAFGLMGTGLADAIKKRPPDKTYNKNGIKIVPNNSICARGFNVNRPINLAVGSPKRSAVQACIYS